MPSNSQIIRDSLSLIGVIGETQPLSAEDGVTGLEVMNEMLSAWENIDEIDISFFEQSDINDDFPCESQFIPLVKYHLAIELAPRFGIQVSSEVAAMAVKYMDMFNKKLVISQVEPADVSHLPMGEGHWPMYNIVTDE